MTRDREDEARARVDREPWLVLASVCDCDKVAVTIMENTLGTDDGPAEGEHEIVATGPDWESLVGPLALAMADRTGLMISSSCSAVYIKDKQRMWEITEAAATLLDSLKTAKA